MIQPEAIGRGGGGGGERRGGGGYPAKVLRPTGLRASPNRASTRGQSKILEQGGRKDLKEVILVLPSPRILQKIRPFDPISGLNTTFFETSVISCSKICLRDLMWNLFP